MANHQRRRSRVTARIFLWEEQTDDRGNVHRVTSTESYPQRVWVYHQRSARAELAGQQEIDVMRIGIDPTAKNVGLWGKVQMLGKTWDIAAPPAYHQGMKHHTEHLSVDLRARPDGNH